MRNWVSREPSLPACGQPSQQGLLESAALSRGRMWGLFFFFPFGKTKSSLLLLLMYFCSSLNTKLWFLKGSKPGRGKALCRKIAGLSGLLSCSSSDPGVWLMVGLGNEAGGRQAVPVTCEPRNLASVVPPSRKATQRSSRITPLLGHRASSVSYFFFFF